MYDTETTASFDAPCLGVNLTASGTPAAAAWLAVIGGLGTTGGAPGGSRPPGESGVPNSRSVARSSASGTYSAVTLIDWGSLLITSIAALPYASVILQTSA